ncbi:hypothetical protein DPMN_192006 [Dreissena polymorpha]|uniref:Uncharacterized protein n=1 Tax=Dreissena polymorpha TaxID=45954 RepID=A0A9D4BEY0_DREPO|nr:hypothetical protein DPMN_192006 [Dreissena polymorpha]
MFALSICYSLFVLLDGTSVLVFIVTFLLIYWSTRRHPGIPPGLGRWPIIGNLGSLAGPTNSKCSEIFAANTATYLHCILVRNLPLY